MHEIIHAEIYRKLLSIANQPNIPWTAATIEALRNSFPGLHDNYTRYWLNIPFGQTIGDVQHELMANHYISTIKNMLENFDARLSPLQSEALAWSGLKADTNRSIAAFLDSNTGLIVDLAGNNISTTAWSNLSSSERVQFNNTLLQYISNQNILCQ
ncbi:MAG: hypothetical protein WBA16_10515 [Nonlabens sp.]